MAPNWTSLLHIVRIGILSLRECATVLSHHNEKYPSLNVISNVAQTQCHIFIFEFNFCYILFYILACSHWRAEILYTHRPRRREKDTFSDEINVATDFDIRKIYLFSRSRAREPQIMCTFTVHIKFLSAETAFAMVFAFSGRIISAYYSGIWSVNVSSWPSAI